MTDSFRTSVLGKTGLSVGRLGLAASYGAPPEALEYGFENGCNYFYTGSGRHRSGMKKAIKSLVSQGHRDKMVIAVQTYARFGLATEFFYHRTLKGLGIDYADILMLGWHNSRPFDLLLNFAAKMKEKGLCRFVGLSGHNRSLFADLSGNDLFDVFHIRYNAAHRGAQTQCFPLLDKPGGPGIVSYTATRWGHLLDARHTPKGQMPLKASDCYRFVLSNPSVNICMCGPKNMHEMKGALHSFELGPLSKEEKERITAIGEHVHQNAGGFFA